MSAKTTLCTLIVSAGFFLVSGPLWAHHAMIADYALNKPVTLKGTITKMEWKNPHGWIYVDVKRDDGKVESWAVETGNPFRMEKGGLKKTDFQTGTNVIIGAFAAKDGKPNAAGWIVAFPDREKNPDLQVSFTLGR